MTEAYVIDAVRPRSARRRTGRIHPVTRYPGLARTGAGPTDIDPRRRRRRDRRCVDAIGGQAGNIARLSWPPPATPGRRVSLK